MDARAPSFVDQVDHLDDIIRQDIRVSLDELEELPPRVTIERRLRRLFAGAAVLLRHRHRVLDPVVLFGVRQEQILQALVLARRRHLTIRQT